MKLKLGLVYVTGGPKGQETVTLGFWNEDATGDPYRYVDLPFKIDMSSQDVEALLRKAINATADLIDRPEEKNESK